MSGHWPAGRCVIQSPLRPIINNCAFAFVSFGSLHLISDIRPAGGQARGPTGPFTSWGAPQLGVQHTRQQEVQNSTTIKYCHFTQSPIEMLSSTNVVNHHHFKISVTIYNGDAPSITTIDLALAPVTQIHELFFLPKRCSF